MRNDRGFTLIEVIVTMVVLGILTSMAIPRYVMQMRAMRNTEAVQSLLSIHAAQKDRQLETGSYTGLMSELDLEIEDADVGTLAIDLENFFDLQIIDGGTDLCGEPLLAIVSANDGGYELAVTTSGEIICAVGVSCTGNICDSFIFR